MQCAGTSGCMHCTVSHHVRDRVVREGEPRHTGAVAPNGHVGRHVIEARAGDSGVRCQGGARQEQGGGQKACGRARRGVWWLAVVVVTQGSGLLAGGTVKGGTGVAGWRIAHRAGEGLRHRCVAHGACRASSRCG